MMMRKLITTVALAGFATSAAALDSTEQRLIDYGFMPDAVHPSQIVNTVEVSHGSVGMDKAAELGFMPVATEAQSSGRFEEQSTTEVTGTEARLQDLGFSATQLNFRVVSSSVEGEEVASSNIR